MRRLPFLLQLPISGWNPGFLAVLILFIATVADAQETDSRKLEVKSLPLPGANGLVMLDYLAYDRTSRRLWVPAGNTGSVDVVNTTTDQIERVEGFAVAQVELRGKLRPVGPSSVAIGDGVVYIGSRADSKICVIDARTLRLGNCIAFAAPSAGMAAAPDGLIYVAATRELWATRGAPPIGIPAADRSIQILSTSRPTKPSPAGKIPLPGSAEGYAVDNLHGRFYTNLEETGQLSPSMSENAQSCLPGVPAHGVALIPALPSHLAGVSRNFQSAEIPLNGLRHPPGGDTCGWFLWAGKLSSEDDFFQPTHVAHLCEMQPSIVQYLGLPPGGVSWWPAAKWKFGSMRRC